MRRWKQAFLLILGLALLPPVPAAAQAATLHVYTVKFVCGTRPAPPNQRQPPPVAPGTYYTAVNVQNSGTAEAKIEVTLPATAEQPAPGPAVSAPALSLPLGRALEIDCADILAAHRRGPFLKGFARLASSQPLEVVAVYSAANQGGVASIDVERYPEQRSGGATCPDLTFGRVTPPVVETSKTTVSVGVLNRGTAPASDFRVRVEDPSRTDANRIAEATIASLAAGEERPVELVLPYAVAPAAVPALVLQVDPKNLVAECREDDNTRTVGSQ